MSAPLFRLVPKWVQAHCMIPDGDFRGTPFLLGAEQAKFMLEHYRVKPGAQAGERAEAFVYRRSQLVRAQKWGKSPLVAAFVCAEGVGPVLFDGWADPGDVYDCRDAGCGCGFVHEYLPGEPKGRQWATPLIQITATSEDQTDNTYDALRPMIELGPLAELIPKTGEEFIRLPNGGRIDAVTSKANSRLGQRITFAVQDETGLWVKANGGWRLSQTQRRGLAGMGGRSIETTNAWDPSQDSVAQKTFETPALDVYKDFRQPEARLSFKDKRERRKILAFNYEGAPWVSVDAIDAEAAELILTDPADAERFFGNRLVAGAGAWLKEAAWKAKAKPRVVPDGTSICLGFDGSDVDDWSGIRAETLDGYQFTPTFHDGRKTIWNPAEFGGRIPRLEVAAAFQELFARYDVVRAYCDPPLWQTEIDALEAQFPKRVFRWETYRPKQMHAALERFKTDVVTPETPFFHDGDELVGTHIRNAVEAPRPNQTYLIFKPHGSNSQKIDLAMSSVLAHEAASDVIAAGYSQSEDDYVYF